MNPVKQQKTIFNQAQESMRSEEAASSNGKAEVGIMLGLALSSLFTIIYMVVALGGSLVSYGWSDVLSYIIGALLGLAAIMPGEAAVWIWKTKLQSDFEINGTQVAVAWIAGLLSAVSAAISTVSFFAFLLQGLMPGWYDADTASGINIANIAIGWAVFGLSVFIYYAAGDSSKRNRNRAKALHVARTAQDQMIAGIAQGTKAKIEELIEGMGENNIFVDDALEQVAKAMGLNEERTQQVRDLAKDGSAGAATSPTSVSHNNTGQFFVERHGANGHKLVIDVLPSFPEAIRTVELQPNDAIYKITHKGKVVHDSARAQQPAPAANGNGSSHRPE